MSVVDERSALELPDSHPRYTNAQARRVAETSGLADALSEHDRDERVWDHAVALLLRMISTDDYRTEIDRYPDARRVLTLVAAGSARVPPTPHRCADLATLVVDLRTGAAACLDWAEYEREAVLDRILSVLRSPPWRRTLEPAYLAADSFAAWRGRWIRDVLDRGREVLGRNRFEIHVGLPVAPGRAVYSGATTRILLDGRPIIAEFFPQGAGEAPEKLLRRPGLWATERPRLVRLAEANCTEGCCGALYVTIVREDDVVVWRDWRTPGPPPPEFRFPAAEYDLEVAGAEHDHSWEWPARTLARHISTALRADPDLLGRWGYSIDWISAWVHEQHFARVVLTSQGERESRPEQFGFLVKADRADLAGQAGRLVETLRLTDPRVVARAYGGM